jgi:hypothetical protein
MSFYTANRTCLGPGPINGNPLNGLCERVCIETKKIFDSCMQKQQLENLLVTATDYTPANPTFPLSYIGATSLTNDPATITNLVIDRLPDRPNYAHVSCDVVIPIQISYTDKNNIAGTAMSSITVSQNVILYVPQPSLVPYGVEVFANVNSNIGTYTNETQFTISCCAVIILKIIVEAQLLIPSYGYCQIPPAQDYTDEVCSGVFDLPVYPMAQPIPVTTSTVNR